MSLSKETQEYHLTPDGWVLGSFKGDVFGGKEDIPNPKDRVLTIECYDKLASAYSKPIYSEQVIWESDNKQQLKNLKRKWGDHPDWIGSNRR